MKIVIPVIALSALIASGASAWSGSSSPTGSLQIKMKIDKECTVNLDAFLNFGIHTALDSDIDAKTASQGAGAIKVVCAPGVIFSIYLDAGSNSAVKDRDDIVNRKMINSKGEYISYQLFTDKKRTTTWASSRSEVIAHDKLREPYFEHTGIKGYKKGGLESTITHGDPFFYPVYGRITKKTSATAKNVAPGEYTDTVTVMVTF